VMAAQPTQNDELWRIAFLVGVDEDDTNDPVMMALRQQFVTVIESSGKKENTDYTLQTIFPKELPDKSTQRERQSDSDSESTGEDDTNRWRNLPDQLTSFFFRSGVRGEEALPHIIVVLDTSAIGFVWKWVKTPPEAPSPIVLAISHNPTEHGLDKVEKPNKDRGTTGIVAPTLGMLENRLMLLRLATKEPTKIAVLHWPYDREDPDKPGQKLAEAEYQQVTDAIKDFGWEVVHVQVTSEDELCPKLADAAKEFPEGTPKPLYVLSSPEMAYHSSKVAAAAYDAGFSGIFPYRKFTWGDDSGAKGGLMSYGDNPFAMIERAALFVVDIMNYGDGGGGKDMKKLAEYAQELPMQGPIEVEWIVNYDTAYDQHILIDPNWLPSLPPKPHTKTLPPK